MPWSVHEGFVADKMAFGHIFIQVLQVSPVSIIPPEFHALHIIWIYGSYVKTLR
jgi:hypothetical protein